MIRENQTLHEQLRAAWWNQQTLEQVVVPVLCRMSYICIYRVLCCVLIFPRYELATTSHWVLHERIRIQSGGHTALCCVRRYKRSRPSRKQRAQVAQSKAREEEFHLAFSRVKEQTEAPKATKQRQRAARRTRTMSLLGSRLIFLNAWGPILSFLVSGAVSLKRQRKISTEI